MNLVKELTKKGLIDKEKAVSLEEEIKATGKKPEAMILEKRIVPEEALFDLKSKLLNIPLKDVYLDDISAGVLESIPEESVKYYQMVPLAKNEDVLDVGMVYPDDARAKEALKFLARQGKFTYNIFLITQSSFENVLKKYTTLKKEVGIALEELEVEGGKEKVEEGPIKKADLERLVEAAPITKMVSVILKHAVDGKASDIHIEPGREKLRVRFRVDGKLYSSIVLPLKVHPAVVARIKILSNLKIDESRVPQDGRFSTNFGNKEIDYRVSTFPTVLGEKVVIRVLDATQGLKTFEELGLEGRNLEVVKIAAFKPFGMILTTGPTGSGKSTTQYAVLRLLNKVAVNIVTLEDPVEYFLEGLNQSQVRPEIGYKFSSGLRSILRQDPDIIMVGEIRDQETAELSIHAALTGHVVLSTLHTNDAIGAIPRFIDMGLEPFLIPSALNIVIAQRLVSRTCSSCKKKIKPEQQVQDIISKEIDSLPETVRKNLNIPKPFTIYEAPGCKKCNFKGLTGRIAVFEILEMTNELSETILKEPSESKIREEARRQGMITMKQDGILKVLRGVTTIEEILRVTD